MKDKYKKQESAMLNFLRSPKGKAIAEKHFKGLKDAKEKFNKEVETLRKYIEDKPNLDAHITIVIAENQAHIDYYDKHHNGYVPITEGENKGSFAEVSPLRSFMILQGYFRKYGEDSRNQFKNEDFLATSYKIDNYNINCYMGQGSFYRIYKDGEILFQI